MAVAVSNSGFDTSDASFSYNNNGNLLVVWGLSNGTITAVSYNSVAMTQLGTSQNNSSTGRNLTVWYLTAPAQGSNTVSWTGGNSDWFGVISFTGVNQTTPVSGTATGGTTGTNPQISVTTTQDNAMVVGIFNDTQTQSAGTGTTAVQAITGGSSQSFRSTNNVTPAGSFTIQTTAASGVWVGKAFGVNPSMEFTMTAALGTFTLTGIAANLLAAYRMTAALGTFTLTGIAAGLMRGYGIIAALGTFTLTGIDAGLTSTRTMTAALGTFTLTGIDAALQYGRVLTAEVGQFVLTGINAILRPSRIWTDEDRHVSTFSDDSRNSSTWTSGTKS